VLVQLDREGGRQYGFFKTSVIVHETTRRNISEELSHELEACFEKLSFSATEIKSRFIAIS
jgi:hypothetical protein